MQRKKPNTTSVCCHCPEAQGDFVSFIEFVNECLTNLSCYYLLFKMNALNSFHVLDALEPKTFFNFFLFFTIFGKYFWRPFLPKLGQCPIIQTLINQSIFLGRSCPGYVSGSFLLCVVDYGDLSKSACFRPISLCPLLDN